MPRPINQQFRQARTEEILSAARDQLADDGLGSFSLRGVARRLELAPNALYTYFPCLDDLITALLIDAFRHLGEALAAADDPSDPECGHCFRRVCAAYRAWAVAHPIDYDLIFGRPIPAYEAPETVVGPVSVQGFEVGLHILARAWRAGQLRIPARYQAVPAGVAATLAAQQGCGEADLPLTLRALMCVVWSRLHGLVTLEIHGNARHAIGDLDAFFSYNVASLAEEIGLSP